MIAYAVRKTVCHLSACLAACWVVGKVSSEGRMYAGFMAAFLGASYLLAGWLKHLKGKGTDILEKLRGQQPPQTPYFHRKEKTRKPLVRLGGLIHPIDDDLTETVDERAGDLPPQQKLRIDAACFGVVGLTLLVLSLL